LQLGRRRQENHGLVQPVVRLGAAEAQGALPGRPDALPAHAGHAKAVVGPSTRDKASPCERMPTRRQIADTSGKT
jgi:hypothetical protein